MENKEIPLLRTRLSIQMFLQFAIWGAWAPVLFKHLLNIGFDRGQAGLIMGTGPLATMISPLIAGQIADRWFPVQRFLGVSYLATGVLLWRASSISTSDFNSMWWLCFASMIVFAPTLGLANAVCFHHLKDARSGFPIIRMFGTIGWIAAAFIVNTVMDITKMDLSACLLVGAVVAVINGIYCFTLPDTPPAKESRDKFAVGKLFLMLKDFSFALFSVLAFFLLVFATFYYFGNADFFSSLHIPDKWLGPTQTIGQAAEIGTMLILPYAYKTLGPKLTIAAGLLAWALRFAMFSIGQPIGLVIASQALHGVCFAFAIASAMIYFERICPPDVRGSMQSFLSWITYGFGMFLGAILMGKATGHFSSVDPTDATKKVVDWHGFWSVPAIGCFVILVIFLIGFRARDTKTPELAEVEAEMEVA